MEESSAVFKTWRREEGGLGAVLLGLRKGVGRMLSKKRKLEI